MKEKDSIEQPDEIGDNQNHYLTRSSLTFIKSGCTMLDCILGGGYPLGRIVNIVGDYSTGKTLLAIELCANFVRKYEKGKIYYHEAEAAFDIPYAEYLGLPIGNVDFIGIENNTIESLFDSLQNVITSVKESGQPTIYIVDSLDALTDEAEKNRAITDGTYGSKAKQLSQLFRRIIGQMKDTPVLIFIISQTRSKVGVMFGEKISRSGGKALDFYASQVVFLKEIKSIQIQRQGIKKSVGIEVEAKIKKNKIGIPYGKCKFPILFSYGIDDIKASIDYINMINKTPLHEIIPKLERKHLRNLDLLRTPETESIAKEIIDLAKVTYIECEENFRPKFKKY